MIDSKKFQLNYVAQLSQTEEELWKSSFSDEKIFTGNVIIYVICSHEPELITK